MKKVTIFTLLAPLISIAQVREKNDIELAGFLGVNSSNYYGDITYNYNANKALNTPIFGITADFYMNSRWSLRTGVEYQTLGSSVYTHAFVDNPQNNNYYTFFYEKEKLNFVALPIHANIHIGKSRNWHINFGPTFSFLTGGKFGNEKIEITNLRKEHLGLGLGFGFRFNINEKFAIGIEHQEYISFTSNTNMIYNNSDFIGNIAGNFSVKAIFKLGSDKEN